MRLAPAVTVELVAGVAALALAGCGARSSTAGSSTASSSGASSSTARGAAAKAPTGSITVFAAASLKDSFSAIGTAFRAADPGTTVTFTFGASSTLAQQIVQGAPADVFASASPTTMRQVVDAKAAAGSTAFAKNSLEIAVPPANPVKIGSLADLAKPGVKVVLCQPQVPCGALARQALARAGVTVEPVSLEADVTATLTKVRLGEADAGLVYVTDVDSAGSTVEGVPIPASENVATTYPLAALTGSRNPDLARAFVAYVLSAAGRAELTKVGFGAP